MSDLILASQGQAEVIAAQEAIRAAAQQTREEFEQGARATGVWDTSMAKLASASQSALNSVRTEQEKIIDQINAINAANARGIGDVKQNEEAVKRLKQQWVEAGDAGKKSFGEEALGEIRNFATELGLVVGAAELIRKGFEEARHEYDSLVELREKAGQTQLDAAGGRKLLLRSLPGSTHFYFDEATQTTRSEEGVVDDLQRGAAIEAEKRLVKSTLQKSPVVDRALAFAYGAGGQNARSESAAELALNVLADQAGGAGELAKSLLTISPASPEENLGFLQQVQGLAGFSGPDALSKIQQPILAGVGYGLSRNTSGALFAALAKGTGDTQGKISISASEQFAKGIHDFSFDPGGKVASASDKSIDKLEKAKQAREAAARELADFDVGGTEFETKLARTKEDREASLRELIHNQSLPPAAGEDQAKRAEREHDAQQKLAKANEDVARAEEDEANERAKRARERQEKADKLAAAQATQAEAERNASNASQNLRGVSELQTIYNSLSGDERLAFLQQHPELADSFIAQAGISGKAEFAARPLLAPGGGALRQNQNLIQSPGRLEARGRDLVKGYGVDPFDASDKFERQLAVFREEQELDGPKYLTARGKQTLIEILQGQGATNRGAEFRTFIGSLKDGEAHITNAEGLGVFKDWNEQLKHPISAGGPVLTPFGDFGSVPKVRLPSPEEQKMIDQNDRMIELLEHLVTAQEKTADGAIGGYPNSSD